MKRDTRAPQSGFRSISLSASTSSRRVFAGSAWRKSRACSLRTTSAATAHLAEANALASRDLRFSGANGLAETRLRLERLPHAGRHRLLLRCRRRYPALPGRLGLGLGGAHEVSCALGLTWVRG